MTEPQGDILRFLGNPAGLQAAVEFTAAETGFIPTLIEKDYWCSVVLDGLFSADDCPLVFKGGTLLSKAYVPFNRLSEDLDFTLPTEPGTSRGARRSRGRALETRVGEALDRLPLETGEWQSFNTTTQHQMTLRYPSVFGGGGTVKLEVGQREAPLRPMTGVPLRTLLLDPLFNEPAVAPVMATALDSIKAYAEKVRATLTRRDPAPRDLYDLHHAVTRGVLTWDDETFLALAAEKLATEPETDWLAGTRIEAFRRSIEPELRPVLRPDAFDEFDFEAAVASMVAIAEALRSHLPALPSNHQCSPPSEC